MPGPITYAAVALLARDRVRRLQTALQAKKANGRRFSEVEKHLLYLCGQTLHIINTAPAGVDAPVPLYGPARGDRLSKFLLMGSIGPELPGYAAMFADGQAWLRDTLHNGTPDANREQVLADSCNLAFTFWRKVEPLLRQDISDAEELSQARLAMQAYVLGHVTHIATDVVSAPFVDSLSWRLGRNAPTAISKVSRPQVLWAIDNEVARVLFGRGVSTRGNDWIDWYPTPKQVPDAFYPAFQQALEELYGPGAKRTGGPGFEKKLADAKPPPLSVGLLKDGYTGFRTVLDTGAAWDYWDWLGATWFMYLPMLLAYPIALALPNGKDYFRTVKPEGYADDAALFELIALPFGMNSLVALYYSIIATTSYLGAESEVIVGWVSAAVQLVATTAFFATLGASGKGLVPRWIVLFGLPLAMQAVHAALTIAKGTANPRRKQILISILLPLGLSLLFVGLYWGTLHVGIEKANDPGDKREVGEFVWRLAVWFVILFVLWWLVPLLLRFVFSATLPEFGSNRLISQQRHGLRLFDDNALLRAPSGISPRLDELFYPSGRRELLKLWWDGGGTAKVRSLRDKLEFTIDGVVTLVPVPAAPMTVSEFAAHLQRVVKRGAATGLRAELFFTAADTLEDHELARDFAFADEADAVDLDADATLTQEQHDARLAAKTLNPFGGDPYVLYHAHKVHQSVRFDQQGATLDTEEARVRVVGVGLVTSLLRDHRVTLAPALGVSRLRKMFSPGDIIEAPIGGARRVVVSVDTDLQLTVSTPFAPALAGVSFQRIGLDHRQPLATPAGWQVNTNVDRNGTTTVTAVPLAGFAFGSMFRAGDSINVHTVPGAPAQGQVRLVVQVISDTLMLLADEFDILAPPSNGPFNFDRIGREPEHLFSYMASADDTLDSGGSVMNHAADLATLLCLSATSQMLTPAEMTAAAAGSQRDLNPVYQIFRNWNLDRRRQNEWKMLVQGGAVSEKRGDATARDEALPPLPPSWQLRVPDGEATSNALGWVNLLRTWADMARRPDADAMSDTSFRPGAPSNRDLTRAMAYLFDMPAPV